MRSSSGANRPPANELSKSEARSTSSSVERGEESTAGKGGAHREGQHPPNGIWLSLERPDRDPVEKVRGGGGEGAPNVSPVLFESALFIRSDEKEGREAGGGGRERAGEESWKSSATKNAGSIFPFVKSKAFDIARVRSTAARLLIFGFPGKQIDSHARKLLDLGAGGFILFSRNVEDPLQVSELLQKMKKDARSKPLLTMVDQEGGRVARLGPPFTSIPCAEMIGSTKDVNAASAAATVLARELSAVNIDMDLAPVVDVATNPDNPVIGDRSFSSEASTVSAMGKAFIQTMQSLGVAACSKHYPGHGDTSVDSHLQLPLLSHNLERLKAVELSPFAASIEAGVAAIMVGHVSCPALNTFPQDSGRPASLSKGAVSFLREEMKFDGLVVTDCLEMGAIVKHFTVEEAAVLAVEAGVDCLMACHTEKRQIAVVEALVQAVVQGRLTLRRLSESVGRLDRVTNRFGRSAKMTPLEVIGSKRHQSIAADIIHQAASFATS